MEREAIVSFLLVLLFLVSVFPMRTFSGAANSQGGFGFPGSPPAIDWWPMFHHDLNHTGYSALTAPPGNRLLWNYPTNDAVFSSPAVADGKVYVGSDDNRTYALNATTGALVWNYTTGGAVDSSPAVADGKVYVGSDDNRTYALNATTGALVWNYTTGGAVDSSPAVVGGIVYVGSHDNRTYALNASTGVQVWNYTTGNFIRFSSPAVVGGIVYVGSLDGNVYALNASTGAEVWNCTTGDRVFSSPAVVGGIVYVGSDRVYALNASTGAQLWNYTTLSLVQSSPAVVGGIVYVGSGDHNVYALDALTGAQLWNCTTGDQVSSSPAVADGIVVAGSWDHNVYALDALTGAQLWNCTTGDQVYSSPTVVDGMVFVGSNDKSVYAFGPPPYDVTLKACCITEGAGVNVQIAMDGSPTSYTTNHTFTGLTGTHTFTVPNVDASGHLFKQWGTGETGTTVTVTSNGTYTAYYEERWPMFHHDVSHTGYSTSTAPNTNQTLWNYTTGDRVFSSPAVVGGIVYVGSRDGNVYALDASTGAKVWNYTTGSWVDSSPAVVGGLVYVGSADQNVYCLNAATGALVWNYTTGGWVDESSPAVVGGIVYVGSEDDNVYALDASTGAFVWNYTTGDQVLSSPAVVGGIVYVGSDHVYALNASTGALVWENYTHSVFNLFSSPAVAGGVVYVGSSDGKVYALNAATGAFVWSYTTVGVVDSSPAVADGKVYVGSDDNRTYALNASTGALVWSYLTGGVVDSSPAVADGIVFVGSDDGGVYAFGDHDVAVTNVTSKTVVGQGLSLNITVAVANPGHYTETFNVTVYANSSARVFRKPITITERSGNNLTDYPVLLTIDTASLISAGKMRPDCGDIRFNEGGSPIPYWIEPGTENSSNTRIWVKVPSIPSSGNTTIYMTYGNSTLSSISNGTTTFPFFDDFKSLDTTKWTVTTSGTAKAYASNGLLVLSASGKLGDGVWVILKSVWNGSYIIGAKAGRQSALGEASTGIIWRVNETGNWYGNEHWVYQDNYNTTDVAALSMSNDAGSTNARSTGVPISSAGVTDYIKRDYPDQNYYSVVDGTQITSLNEVANGSWTTLRDTNNVGISASNYGDDPSFNFTYDWFFVSKYVSPEPSATVGEEEISQTNATQTVTLSFGNSTNITFTLNTTPLFAKGNYTISAYAQPVPGETNIADNNFTEGMVTVAMVGDLTGPNGVPDGKVDIRDIALVAKAFGSAPGMPGWNANVDITGSVYGVPDGKVDIRDIALVAKHFGEGGP
jgi:outer membrane protein assembly factor BamB